MPDEKAFTVIIVGGGIAGLTLALMLEKFNIDYIVLESYRDVTPQAGASFGMAPNGLLILDQLGVYEDIARLSEIDRKVQLKIRSLEGKPLSMIEDQARQIEICHGYATTFLDRQYVLQALYAHIQHKDRILTSKRVDKFTMLPNAVQVHTKDGSVFTGDMVVGADGIRSQVRKTIYELSHDDGIEDANVPATFKCSFGVAQDVENWDPQDFCFTLGQDKAMLAVEGPGKRVYWGFFVRLPEPVYGDDIPQYGREDDAIFAAEHAETVVTEKVKFKDLYARRVQSNVSALHEHVFQRWFFERMVLVGDACHKASPMGGQGGNHAFETCAELINALTDLEARRPGGVGLKGATTQELTAAFAQMQEARFARASAMVAAANAQGRIMSSENPAKTRLAFHVMSRISGPDAALAGLGARCLPASRIKRLPVPFRPRIVPFDVELPSKPLAATSPALVKGVKMAFIGAMGVSTVLSWSSSSPFSSSPSPSSPYSFSQLISPLLIYTIEGIRVGNQRSLLGLAGVPYTAGISYLGLDRIAPIHALVSGSSLYEGPAQRRVSVDVARSLLPALALGYIVPSIIGLTSLSSSPSSLPSSSSSPGLLPQAAPLIFSTITTVLSSALFQFRKKQATTATTISNTPGEKESGKQNTVVKKQRHFDAIKDRYSIDDVPVLRLTLLIAAGLQAAVHSTAVISSLSSSSPLPLLASLATIGNTTAFCQTLYSVWTLRKNGFVTNRTAVRAAAAVLLGQVLVGPGATWAAVWSWREGVVAGLSTHRIDPEGSRA